MLDSSSGRPPYVQVFPLLVERILFGACFMRAFSPRVVIGLVVLNPWHADENFLETETVSGANKS